MMKNEKIIWTPICMSVGIGLGMLIGSLCGQIPAGLCTGIGFGLVSGVVIDRISRKKNG